MAALQHDNLPLLRVIVESDAVHDLTKFAREDWHFKILGNVLKEGDMAHFKDLLAQNEAELLEQEVRKTNARDNTKLQNCCRFDSFRAPAFCRDIDLSQVVCSGDYTYLEDVLRLISRHGCPHLHPVIDTLRLVVLQGRLDLAELLMDFHSHLLDESRMQPWLLLEAASLYGDIDVFDRLMAMGLNPCATNERGLGSALAAACLYQNRPLVRHLLQLGVDVNGRCHGGSDHSTLERTYRIQLEDIFVDLETVKGLTGLQVAVLCEDVETILLLLSYGANASKRCTPDTDSLTLLLGCQATGSWYNRSNFAGWIWDDLSPTPPLHSGMFFNGYRFAPRNLALGVQRSCLLKCEIQPSVSTASAVWGTDEKDELGLTSLMSGLELSNPASNSDVNFTERQTLSYHELEEKLSKVLTQIPDCAQSVDDRKHYLHAICDEAARSGNLGIIQTVLDDDLSLIDSELRYSIGISTLIHALQAGNSGTVAGLLNLGTDPNTSINCFFNRSGLADALQFAALQNDKSLVELLIARGANVNASPFPEAGATALQFAARNANFEILEILLAAGAELNAPPGHHHGMSAIEGAAAQGRLDMVRYLLQRGADMRGRKNLNYRRTVYRAWNQGHRPLANIIQEWKRETYGQGDVESIDVITKTLKQNELKFSDFEAVALHARYGGSGDIFDLLLAGVGSGLEVSGVIDGVEWSMNDVE
jgi:ankyrin repeat protein